MRVLNLTLDSQFNIPNNDGIHITSKDVIIRGCHIIAGDDCIATASPD